MATLTKTAVDNGGVLIQDILRKTDTFATAAAKTYPAGTILARKQVDDAVVVAADGGNTGDGTVTLATVSAGDIIPLVGAYNLECIEAVTNGGVFKLEDPNGALVATELVMTAGAGAATEFNVAGLTFTITDATTDFIVGDKFSLTVAANGKLVVFATDGAGGAQYAKTLLPTDLVSASATDYSVRVLIEGEVRKDKLIIDADGDDSNVDMSVRDQLQDFNIAVTDVTEQNKEDN